MHRGLEIAVGGVLHQLADVDDERVLDRWCVDPASVVLDLQATLSRFDEQ